MYIVARQKLKFESAAHIRPASQRPPKRCATGSRLFQPFESSWRLPSAKRHCQMCLQLHPLRCIQSRSLCLFARTGGAPIEYRQVCLSSFFSAKTPFTSFSERRQHIRDMLPFRACGGSGSVSGRCSSWLCRWSSNLKYFWHSMNFHHWYYLSGLTAIQVAKVQHRFLFAQHHREENRLQTTCLNIHFFQACFLVLASSDLLSFPHTPGMRLILF